MSTGAYAELMATSNFSFLRSGSHPEELVSAAMALGLVGWGLLLPLLLLWRPLGQLDLGAAGDA
jgi:hypothetical protein